MSEPALDQWREQFRADAGTADQFAPAETPAEPADTVDEGETDAQPPSQARDEAGRFTAEAAPEPEAEADAEAPAEGEPADPDLQAYLSKYGGDTTKALLAAVEAQKIIGRQGSELGDLRKELSERFDKLEQAQQTPSYTPDSVEAALDENPTLIPEVAYAALQRGDEFLYQKAMSKWDEYDAAGARAYASEVAAHKAVNALREELAPVISTAQQQAEQIAAQQAVEQVTARRPDFAQVIEQITPETLESVHPSVIEAVKTGDATSKAKALETLYLAAKASQADNLPHAVQAAARTTQQQASQERQDAAVGTASSQSPATRETPDRVDAWREQFRNSPEYRKAAGLA